MKVFRSVKTNIKTQDFYGDRACARVYPDGKPYWPWKIKSVNSLGLCPLGYKKFYPMVGLKTHGGDDWMVFFKEDVLFPADSEGESAWSTFEVNDDTSLGLELRIRSLSPVTLHESELPPEMGTQARALWKKLGGKIYVKFVYAHAFDNLPSQKNQPVSFGEKIQLADSTGASSNHHVHEGFKFCDEQGNTLDRDNGWRGNCSLPKSWDKRDVFVGDFLEIKKGLLKAALELAKIALLLTRHQLMLMQRKVGGLFR